RRRETDADEKRDSGHGERSCSCPDCCIVRFVLYATEIALQRWREMSKGRSTRRIAATDLEQTVLGIVWRDGPCTPYHVRSVLLRSPSSHWSGSAGAIYPLVKRLEARGLARSRAVRTGRRAGREVELTDA